VVQRENGQCPRPAGDEDFRDVSSHDLRRLFAQRLLVDGIQEVLEREDLTHEQRQEIAQTLLTSPVSFAVDELTVTIKNVDRPENGMNI